MQYNHRGIPGGLGRHAERAAHRRQLAAAYSSVHEPAGPERSGQFFFCEMDHQEFHVWIVRHATSHLRYRVARANAESLTSRTSASAAEPNVAVTNPGVFPGFRGQSLRSWEGGLHAS